jgi:hypothetical protein
MVHPSPGFIELQVDNFNSKSFNVSPVVHHFVRNMLWKKKMLGQQKIATFFNS